MPSQPAAVEPIQTARSEGNVANRSYRPTLSLIMIVRDEADNLPDLLGPIHDKFDEVIVVDTGSVDGTPEIARQYGAKVFFFDWINDFSAARNESIRHATGDWVMWLDGDDRMRPEEVGRVRKLIARNPERDVAYYCHLRSLASSWSGDQSLLQIRVFPNRPEIRFAGEVHERITESLTELGMTALPSSVEIVHTGYMNPDALPEKYARNLAIMERMLENNPDDLQTRYQLIMQLAAMQLEERTLAEIATLEEKVRCVTDQTERVYRFLLLKGLAYRNFGKNDVAREAFERVVERLPKMGVGHYLVATVDYHEGKWDAMREHLLKAEYHGIAVEALPIPLARIHFDIGLMLGRYYERNEQWIRAAQEYRKTLTVDEECLSHYLRMGNCYRTGQAHERAVAAYDAGLRVHDRAVARVMEKQPELLEKGTEEGGSVIELTPEARSTHVELMYYGRAQSLSELGRLEETREALDKGLERLPTSAPLMISRMEWELRHGSMDAAREQADRIITAHSDSAEVFQAVINAHLMEGKTAESAPLLAQFWRAHPDQWDAALVGVLSALRVGDREAADELLVEMNAQTTAQGVARAAEWPDRWAANHPILELFSNATLWASRANKPGQEQAYASKLAAIASSIRSLLRAMP